MNKKALLKLENGKEVELAILEGKCGPSALDIKDLYKNTGLFTYDPGFVSTAACSSSITFIDGEEGKLLHRGYEISQLIEYDFLSVVYLLLYGNLPAEKQYKVFISQVQTLSRQMPKEIKHIIQAFPTSSHPMPILMACFSCLAASYHVQHGSNIEDLSFGVAAVAQVSVIIAMIYNHVTGKELAEVSDELSYSKNFLKMISVRNDATSVKALDKIFILHADHEQNASTAAVRLSGSTNANLLACITAGITALWGPAHGGANEAVIGMLEEIKHPSNIGQFIEKVKNGKFKLMGFGHRVYKNYDPRASELKKVCTKVLNDLGIHDNHLFEVAMELEKIALSDEYFIERKLYPNVDFYSGIILRAMGIPTNMFTPIFALARTAGWVAQWYEMKNSKESKIWRPRQLYIGN
ncbi:citrate synthase [Candidatus Mesenet endosymbiont of Agriotes lineatus]|uniref:citrate synthase n=1 Tax=Candidatus Mesenet endosymbiont of Agriotes lineatus TaxID=3077948 RepID=UPI0030D57689